MKTQLILEIADSQRVELKINPVNTQCLGAAFAITNPFWTGMFLLNRIQDIQKKTDF